MSFDDGGYIRHTAIAQFYGVLVEYLVKTRSVGEVFVDETEKSLSKICGHVPTKWWVKPDDITTSILSFSLVHIYIYIYIYIYCLALLNVEWSLPDHGDQAPTLCDATQGDLLKEPQ